ncbi:MAG: zinc ribbon domain-containing protein [Chloroflexota bacterium]|jgi:RNA polymerase subunit RPABC4/transcription elongation factor Spt4|uniref:zinc ribbon domain-containing protein n=1 Tax=Bellilinea sp. TaxID=2838785 RepID=UPI002ADDD6BD|nr:zinc ribbon domain-containing protein [Bellilinea sp.]
MDTATLGNLALVAAAFAAAFLAALWLSLILWTYRDIRSRSRDPLIRILALLVVGVLFLPGVLIYLILRPSRTLEEEYQRTLEEEALLQNIEDTPVCPGCTRRIQPDWQICPNCHTRLKKICHHCGKLMELSWNLCPYCGTPAPGMRREAVSIEDALQHLPLEEIEENRPASPSLSGGMPFSAPNAEDAEFRKDKE